MDIKKFKEIDLYQFLDIESSATEEEIRRAYRRKALQVHPDKNPSEEAKIVFQDLQNALKILTDETARKAYDRMRYALKQQEIRNRQLDNKKAALKRKLEEREKEAATTKSPEEIFEIELKRLKKEGEQIVQEETEKAFKEYHESLANAQRTYSKTEGEYRLKIKWSCAKDDTSNGGYNDENLHTFLNKYGDITALIISKKKKGSAIVEFKDYVAADMAIQYEKGIISNPLKIQWLVEPPESIKSHRPSQTAKATDYETLVMRQMRLAEERKRIIEQMQREEELEDQG